MDKILNTIYWGNSLEKYLLVFGGMILAWGFLRLIKKLAVKKLSRWASETSNRFDDVIVSAIDRFALPIVYLMVNYSLIHILTLSTKAERVLSVAVSLITMIFIVNMINYAIHYGVRTYMEMKAEPSGRMKQLTGILTVIKVIIWFLGILLLASNIGYDITTIIAGLGVGGIAIALAAQNILGDLFSYFVIFFDKPFEVGDFVVVGNEQGAIEKIGVKTVHVRSISGEQLIMPNSELVKATIKNFKRLEKRRKLFLIGVTYSTDPIVLAEIPNIIKDIISKTADTELIRCHLSGFADSSINYEVVYFVLSNDFIQYMDTHQQICLSIASSFKEKQIEFAFPSQTIYIKST
jgi:small-conductance mechanosensitive channel